MRRTWSETKRRRFIDDWNARELGRTELMEKYGTRNPGAMAAYLRQRGYGVTRHGAAPVRALDRLRRRRLGGQG